MTCTEVPETFTSVPGSISVGAAGAVVSTVIVVASLVVWLPAASVVTAVRVYAPCASEVVNVTVCAPPADRIWVATTVAPSISRTTSPAAASAPTATVMVWLIALVMLSLSDAPLSEAAARSGAPTVPVTVSRVTVSEPEVLSLPAASLRRTV